VILEDEDEFSEETERDRAESVAEEVVVEEVEKEDVEKEDVADGVTFGDDDVGEEQVKPLETAAIADSSPPPQMVSLNDPTEPVPTYDNGEVVSTSSSQDDSTPIDQKQKEAVITVTTDLCRIFLLLLAR